MKNGTVHLQTMWAKRCMPCLYIKACINLILPTAFWFVCFTFILISFMYEFVSWGVCLFVCLLVCYFKLKLQYAIWCNISVMTCAAGSNCVPGLIMILLCGYWPKNSSHFFQQMYALKTSGSKTTLKESFCPYIYQLNIYRLND